MAGIFKSIGRLFGFDKSKDQGQFQGEQIKGPLEFETGRRTFSGRGGIEDALSRIGTGFTKELIDKGTSTAVKAGQRMFRGQLGQIGAQSSAAGLGRSSLRQSQNLQAAEDVDLATQQQINDLIRQSQQAEIQQQMQGRSLGTQFTGMDVGAQQAKSQQQFAEFNRQQGFRERAEANQQAGLLRSALTLGGGVAGGLGGLPGVDAGIGGLGQGALAGLSGDLGMFQKPASAVQLNLGGDDDFMETLKKLQEELKGAK